MVAITSASTSASFSPSAVCALVGIVFFSFPPGGDHPPGDPLVTSRPHPRPLRKGRGNVKPSSPSDAVKGADLLLLGKRGSQVAVQEPIGPGIVVVSQGRIILVNSHARPGNRPEGQQPVPDAQNGRDAQHDQDPGPPPGGCGQDGKAHESVTSSSPLVDDDATCASQRSISSTRAELALALSG